MPADRFVNRADVQLHVRDWRDESASGPDVLMLHGLASTCRIWDLVAPLLAAAGLRPVALDQRGHGMSDRPERGYGFDEVTADALAAAEQLGLDRPVVAGHSWGASVALSLASKHAARFQGLVAVDGAFGGMKDRMTWDEAWERMKPPRIRATREEIAGYIKQGPLAEVWSDEIEAAVLSVFERGEDGKLVARLPFAAHEEIFRAIYGAGQAEWMQALVLPALLLPTRRGADDEWARSKQSFLATIANPLVRVQWLEDSIHDVPLQRPRLVADAIAAFAAGTRS